MKKNKIEMNYKTMKPYLKTKYSFFKEIFKTFMFIIRVVLPIVLFVRSVIVFNNNSFSFIIWVLVFGGLFWWLCYGISYYIKHFKELYKELEIPIVVIWILVNVSSYIASLIIWFSKPHHYFWEGAKELIWALMPIINIIYVYLNW